MHDHTWEISTTFTENVHCHSTFYFPILSQFRKQISAQRNNWRHTPHSQKFLVNPNVRDNFSVVATHSTILVLRNDKSRFCWHQWRAIFFKLSVYSKLPPGLGCTAPSYLPRPRPGWCPCVGRGYQPGRGAAFVTRNISCSSQQPPAEGGLWVSIY